MSEEKKKFQPEELEKVKALQERFNNLILQFGQLNIERVKLENTFDKLKNVENELKVEYEKLLTDEKSLSDELSTKYGMGVLNPQTGEFTPYDGKKLSRT